MTAGRRFSKICPTATPLQAFVAGAVVISVINKQGYRLVGGAANGASISDLAALQLAAPIPTKAEPACAARSLTPRQRECLARGEAFKANLPGGGARNGPHPFDVPFVSPITTARDNVFFDFAAHTPTDKITSHGAQWDAAQGMGRATTCDSMRISGLAMPA